MGTGSGRRAAAAGRTEEASHARNPRRTPVLFGEDPAAIRGADWGGLRSMVVSLPAAPTCAPLLQGAAGDLCPCPHWGY
jgi:hypothetical protein